MTLEHEELTGEIIAAAIAVHKDLGPGFVESIYAAVKSEHGLILNFAGPKLQPKRVMTRDLP